MPLPPGLLTTALGAAKSFLSCQMRCTVRAVRSSPPPAADGTISSTFFSGFHAGCACDNVAAMNIVAAAITDPRMQGLSRLSA